MGQSGFETALRGRTATLVRSDGVMVPLPVRRWRSGATGLDRWVLERCTGPTIDLGCGPGRLVEALTARGVPALGVDLARSAVRLGARRGASVLRRDVLGPLPAEGRWRHALLVDGNIGIGGDPVRLLRRVARLLTGGGTALVELAPSGGLWQGTARVRTARRDGPPLPWSTAGLDAVGELIRQVPFAVTAQRTGARCFVELTRATAA